MTHADTLDSLGVVSMHPGLKPFSMECPAEACQAGKLTWAYILGLASLHGAPNFWHAWALAQSCLSPPALSSMLDWLYEEHGYSTNAVCRLWCRARATGLSCCYPHTSSAYPTPKQLYCLLEEVTGMKPTWMVAL